MNWEAIGAVGEVGGAIAVVLTLAYLAKQIRSGTQAAVAATTWQASQAMAELHGRANARPDLADVWLRGLSEPETLSEDALPQFITLTAESFHLYEGLYRQWRMGYLADESWRPIARLIRRELQSPLVAEWWDSGMGGHSEEFRAYADSIREADDERSWQRDLGSVVPRRP